MVVFVFINKNNNDFDLNCFKGSSNSGWKFVSFVSYLIVIFLVSIDFLSLYGFCYILIVFCRFYEIWLYGNNKFMDLGLSCLK